MPQSRRRVNRPGISMTKYISGTKNEIWRDYLPVFHDVGGSDNYAATT